MNVKLIPISPIDLHAEWPKILKGVFKIHVKGRTDWWPEDVYAAIKFGQAQLFQGVFTDGTYAGFLVVVPQTDPHSGRKSLLIWLACSSSYGKGIVESALEELRSIARRGSFDTLVFYSPRRGWERRLPDAIVGDVKYEIKV